MSHKTEPIKLIKNTTYISAKQYDTGSVPLHWHNFYEIELVVSGHGTITVNGNAYPWQTGQMSFMRLTDFHEIELHGTGNLHLIQIPSSSLPEPLLKLISTTKGNLITSLSPKNFAYAHTLCRMIAEETNRGAAYNEEQLTHLLAALMHLFATSLGAAPNTSVSNDTLIGKLLLYISENFRQPLTLTQIANQFFISKNYLCYYFKQQMHVTVMEYLRELRLEYAAKLAVTTHIKSIEISEACGYGSVSHFLRDFKRKYSISPLAMRKQTK